MGPLIEVCAHLLHDTMERFELTTGTDIHRVHPVPPLEHRFITGAFVFLERITEIEKKDIYAGSYV